METFKDPKILVAIITSLAAAIAAIVTIVNTRIIVKNNAKNSKELEMLKFQMEKEKALSKIPESHILNRLDAIDNIVRCIQTMKDQLIVVMKASNDSLDSKTAIMMIRTARIDFFQIYESLSTHLEKEDDKAAHEAKNISFEIETSISTLYSKKRFINLTHDKLRNLVELKSQLTDCQNILRDRKLKLIYQN